ncbi:hypothetical protein QUB63_19460 [Microcoleus sp. ARI1-B5]|uniref:hypothetical protein n=1 Tax=unclassified Microcoleus TaxID=2642155 RepID=UPI002FD009FF
MCLTKLRSPKNQSGIFSKTERVGFETLRRSLGRSDGLVRLRNQEVSALKSRLALRDETIAELGEQIDRLESELASREPTQSEKSTPTGTDLSKVEAADLLNQLKAERKKSRMDLGDMETLLRLLVNASESNS